MTIQFLYHNSNIYYEIVITRLHCTLVFTMTVPNTLLFAFAFLIILVIGLRHLEQKVGDRKFVKGIAK